MTDALKTDARLVFDDQGGADIAAGGHTAGTIEGKGNLIQALTMRILVGRGEIEGLSHARYGSRVSELIGEPLDGANLALLRRFVRAALKDDPRVSEVTSLQVAARADAPGVVQIDASVTAVTGDVVEVGLAIALE